MSNKPKPARMRLLEGNRGHRPIPDNPEPQSCDKFPYAPRHLDRIAKREWRRRGKELWDLGILTLLDLPAFEIYCDLYSQWYHAGESRVAYAKEVRMFMNEFGMTPSSRTKIKVDKPRASDSKWDKLING